MAAKIKFVKGDFFEFKDTFDVGYDYTLFCAVHPTMRATLVSSAQRGSTG